MDKEKKSGGGCCGGKSTNNSKEEKKDSGRRLSVTGNGDPKREKRKRTKQTDNTNTTPNHAEGKVILLGESGVGKSSIAMRYVESKFEEGSH